VVKGNKRRIEGAGDIHPVELPKRVKAHHETDSATQDKTTPELLPKVRMSFPFSAFWN
jgi:hypothetical protein